MPHATQPTIRALAACPQFVPQVAQWIYEQWWTEVAGASPATLSATLRENLSRTPLPHTLVACEGTRAVGTVSILAHDVGTARWAQLSPWLAALYVAPAARRCGVGTALIEAARAHAAGFTPGPLYLLTFGPGCVLPASWLASARAPPGCGGHDEAA
jgi:GNAT superfamily N-acetyltransferase